MGGGVVKAAPWPLYPQGNTQYPLYRRLGGPQGWPGWVQKISLLMWFDPRTVQPVASRYTDWATPGQTTNLYVKSLCCKISHISSRCSSANERRRSGRCRVHKTLWNARVWFLIRNFLPLNLNIKFIWSQIRGMRFEVLKSNRNGQNCSRLRHEGVEGAWELSSTHS